MILGLAAERIHRFPAPHAVGGDDPGAPRVPFEAVAWSGARVLGFTPTAKLSAIGRAVQDRADEFIRASLAVNPRR